MLREDMTFHLDTASGGALPIAALVVVAALALFIVVLGWGRKSPSDNDDFHVW